MGSQNSDFCNKHLPSWYILLVIFLSFQITPGVAQPFKVNPTRRVTQPILPGSSIDATGTYASFNGPSGLDLDSNGYIYVADCGYNLIRSISPTAVVTTIAGNGRLIQPQGSYLDETGTSAEFNCPVAVAINAATNTLYILEYYNFDIRAMDLTTGMVTGLAGSHSFVGHDADGVGTEARFYIPTDMRLDSSGNLWVADTGNNKIKMVTPTGTVTTFFSSPTVGLAIDTMGYVYNVNHNVSIVKISPAGSVVSTLAGGNSGFLDCADGVGSNAHFSTDNGNDVVHQMVLDADGDNLYMSSSYCLSVRKIETATGLVTTVSGVCRGGEDECYLFGITISASDNTLYVSDYCGEEIRKIDAASGAVTTRAGRYAYGNNSPTNTPTQSSKSEKSKYEKMKTDKGKSTTSKAPKVVKTKAPVGEKAKAKSEKSKAPKSEKGKAGKSSSNEPKGKAKAPKASVSRKAEKAKSVTV